MSQLQFTSSARKGQRLGIERRRDVSGMARGLERTQRRLVRCTRWLFTLFLSEKTTSSSCDVAINRFLHIESTVLVFFCPPPTPIYCLLLTVLWFPHRGMMPPLAPQGTDTYETTQGFLYKARNSGAFIFNLCE